jgi:hypothetical protein
MIARFYRCTVGVEWTKRLTVKEGEKEMFVGYAARAVVYDNTGKALSAAEANCTINEIKWKTRDTFQIKSMAQTRACAKALRNVFAWVVVIKGFRATPAEEMDEYEVAEKPVAQEVSAQAQDQNVELCSVEGCLEVTGNKVVEFSMRKYGKVLCFKHQKEADKQ